MPSICQTTERIEIELDCLGTKSSFTCTEAETDEYIRIGMYTNRMVMETIRIVEAAAKAGVRINANTVWNKWALRFVESQAQSMVFTWEKATFTIRSVRQ